MENDAFYIKEKVYDVRYGNLFDEHMTYSFIGFDNDTAVSNKKYLNSNSFKKKLKFSPLFIVHMK